MRAPHWKVFYRPPPPLLESISDSVHCRVAQEGCIVRREKWYHHVAGARWISYSFSSALSFSPEIYLLMGCCCTNVSCIGISLFVAVKYFTLDPNCTFKNISRCNITHAHLIPGGENRDFYCYCCIVTHPICVSKEAAASLKKLLHRSNFHHQGVLFQIFFRVSLRSNFRQFLSQLCIMSKVCSVI